MADFGVACVFLLNTLPITMARHSRAGYSTTITDVRTAASVVCHRSHGCPVSTTCPGSTS